LIYIAKITHNLCLAPLNKSGIILLVHPITNAIVNHLKIVLWQT